MAHKEIYNIGEERGIMNPAGFCLFVNRADHSRINLWLGPKNRRLENPYLFYIAGRREKYTQGAIVAAVRGGCHTVGNFLLDRNVHSIRHSTGRLTAERACNQIQHDSSRNVIRQICNQQDSTGVCLAGKSEGIRDVRADGVFVPEDVGADEVRRR